MHFMVCPKNADKPCASIDPQCDDCVLRKNREALPPVAGEPVAVPLQALTRKVFLALQQAWIAGKNGVPFIELADTEKQKDLLTALAAAPLTASKGQGVQSDDGALGENSGSVLSDHSSPSEGATARDFVAEAYERDVQKAIREIELASEFIPGIAGCSPASAISTLAFRLMHAEEPQDALRYRWLRKNNIIANVRFHFVDGQSPYVYAEALDDAIDAALASSTAAGAEEPNSPIPESESITCNPHPDAPHGFDRNSSHNAGRYVCECESWTAPESAGVREALSDEKIKGENDGL